MNIGTVFGELLRDKKVVYDVLSEEEGLKLVKYQTEIISRSENGKNKSFRRFNLIDSSYPENMTKEIQNLRSLGAISVLELPIMSFDTVLSTKVMGNFRLMLRSRTHKILEKIYEEVIIDNQAVISTYIICINMKNGKRLVEHMGYIPYSQNNITKLTENGYKYIADSELINYLDSLSNKKAFILPEKNPTR